MSVKAIVDMVYRRVCGSCDDVIQTIESMIDEGDLDTDEYYSNETEILQELDDVMFSCEICGWNYETSERCDSIEDRCVCNSCGDDEGE